MKKSVGAVVVALMAVVPAAWAGGARPQPYKSPEGTIAVPHPILYSNTGSVNDVTAKEFEQNCSIPASNGVDAYVFAVPKAFQKTTAAIEAVGTDTGPGGYDLDMYFYDKTCKNNGAANASGTDEYGVIPKGTAFVLVDNYLGDPNVSVHIELKSGS